MRRDMPSPNARVQSAEKEAAVWHARLGAPNVTAEAIEDFFAWRSRPENADAYRRVEQVWGAGDILAKDARVRSATNAVLTRAAPRRSEGGRRGWILTGALAGLVITLGGVGAYWSQARGVFDTNVGEQHLERLADGSVVRLDTDTRIRVRYDDNRRVIDLDRGRALFDVAHDVGRPFIVRAGGAEVVAVGTVFDVRRRGGWAEIALVSGVVDVAAAGPGAAKVRLVSGQAVSVSQGAIKEADGDVVASVSWTEGRLTFQGTPLGEATAEVNRYLPNKVRLDVSDLAGAKIDGVFNTGDRDAFVAAVSDLYGLEAVAGSDGSVRLTRAKK